MRIAFIIILSLHGLIHLIGLFHALGIKADAINSDIPRQQGYFWGLATVLFLLTAVLFYLENELWWLIGLIAILVSQWLIILTWQDSKFGTIANIIILAAVIYGIGNWAFDRRTNELRNERISNEANADIHPEQVKELPPAVQQWLSYSNVTGRSFRGEVMVKQSGRMKLEPDADWIPFNAEQWFTTDPPGFIWSANVGTTWLNFRGRDLLIGGRGSMLIRLYGLIPVVDADGQKMDQGAMVRFLSEMIWMPWISTADYIVWEHIDDHQAKASIHWNDSGGTGIFTFDEMGRPIQFTAKRYYNRGNDATLENWIIKIDPESYTSYDGILVPTRASVSWELENGTFTWLDLNIDTVSF